MPDTIAIWAGSSSAGGIVISQAFPLAGFEIAAVIRMEQNAAILLEAAMPSCSYCGRYILFGGVKTETQRYCNDVCHTNELLRHAAMSVPDSTLESIPDSTLEERVESALEARVEAVHSGECPQCGGMGPIDVHRAHTVFSFITLTKWQSVPIVSCRGCATRQQYRSILKSALLGWWGFPYGLLLTPLQIGRNIVGLMGGPEAAIPSEQLRSVVRHMIAAELQATSARVAEDREG